MKVLVFLNPKPWPLQIIRMKDMAVVFTDDADLAKVFIDMRDAIKAAEDQVHELKRSMCGVPNQG